MIDQELLARIDERQKASVITQDAFQKEVKDSLKDILTQTTNTNGRVTSLETWRAKLGGIWKAIAIGSFVGGVIVSLIIELFK